MLTYLESLKIHANKRLMERYGIELTKELLKKWVLYIQSGGNENCLFGEKQPNNRSKWLIVYNNGIKKVIVNVIYDEKLKTIVTALPKRIYKKRNKSEKPLTNKKNGSKFKPRKKK